MTQRLESIGRENESLCEPDGDTSLYLKPRTEIEETLARIWAEVLELDRVGIQDDFFDLGGDSLMATVIISHVRESLGAELPMLDLFETPTVAAMAESLESTGQEHQGLSIPKLKPAPRERAFRLSYAQKGIWFLDQLEAGQSIYNVPRAISMEGELNTTALIHSIREIVRRHEALRTIFTLVDGEPAQEVISNISLSVPIIDLRSLLEEEVEKEARRVQGQEARRVFDLATGPLMRAAVVRLEDRKQVLMLTMHHIVSDGWSVGVLFDELKALYGEYEKGEPTGLRELAIQYGDYAYWQEGWMKGEVLEGELEYWRKQLEGAEGELRMPTDRGRPAEQTFEGGREEIKLTKETSEGLREMSREESVSLYMTLLAGFKVMINRYTGETDIVVGTPIANRNRAEVEGLIGFFVNTLAMRSDLRGNPSFRELMGRTREMALGAYGHQELPFEKLVEELKPERSLSRTPIFQVMFALQNAPAKRMELGELRVRRMEVESGTEKFDLTVEMKESEEGIEGTLSYNKALFDKTTCRRMARRYEQVLEEVVRDREKRLMEIGILREEERQQVLVEWNDVKQEWEREVTLVQKLEKRVSERPDAVALVYGEQSVTYGELNERANQLGHYLRRRGVGADAVVGICMKRSVEMVIGLIGVLKAGGAYLPIDVDGPVERLRYMLEDAEVKAVVTESRKEGVDGWDVQVVSVDGEREEIGRESRENPDVEVTGENLAYVIYTSGSTGQPKGVMIRHSGLSNHMEWIEQRYGIGEEDCVYQKTPYSFDASVWEFYAGLMTGGRLVVAREGGHQEAEYLVEEMLREGVTIVQVVPTMLGMLVEEEKLEECKSVRAVFSGGEALQWEMRKRVEERMGGVELVNLYGPTETTIDATHWSCRGEGGGGEEEERGGVPIGKPVANAGVYVLDGEQRAVPMGVNGELYISGAGIARGYLGKAELTAERMVPNGYSEEAGARMYRTGDVVRWRGDGNLEFWGRVDHQVKVRGYRIELGEIEEAMCGCEGIRQAVVIAREDERGEKRLVGYVVSEREVRSSELRERLKGKLPEYMVPGKYIEVRELPLTPNGKLDRKALIEVEEGEEGREWAEAETPTEELLVGMWTQMLGLERVGIHENFFELGGHSLIATRVISRVRKAFGVEMSVRKIFESPTIAELADEIEGMRGEGKELGAIRLRAEKGKGPIPLSFAQKRIWFLDQLEAGQSIYNVPMAISIEGELNTTALVHSIREIVRRHEALRTIFTVVDGEPAQEVNSNISLSVPIIDLRSLLEEEVEKEARRVQGQEARRVFDLATGPLMRAAVVRLEDRKQVLMLTMHHIVSDGWSVGVLFDELKALYGEYEKGEPTGLRELAIQYGDYACWQEGWMKGEVLEGELEYWRKQLEGAEGELRMPTDRGRPAEQTFEGGREEIRLTKETSEGLREMSREESVSLYMTLLAGFKVMINRYTGETDIVVGTPIANRNRAEVEGLIGFFVNTLAMRSDLRGNPSFRELMGRTREVALGAYGHQELPFEKLVEEVEPERSLSRTPIFQVMFAVQNAPAKRIELGELRVRRMEVEAGTEKFDITVGMKESEEGIEGTLSYNKALFDKTTCRRMARRYEQVLEEVVRDREKRLMEIGILREEERQQVLVEWNDTGREREQGQCVDEILEREVRERPDAIAVEYGEEKLSYRELNRRGNQLGRYVRRRGVRAGEVVGICMERSLEMVIGLIGVVKAGGAYLPLGQENPDERLRFMIEDTGVRVVIAGKEEGKRIERIVEEREKEGMGEEREKREVEVIGVEGRKEEISEESGEDERKEERWAEKLAYVMYTSGTTGEPKGIGVSHGGIVRLVRGVEYAEMRGEVFLQYAPISFDASTFEIWGSLLNGGRLVVAPEKQATLEELGRMLKEKEITTLWLTAGLFQAMVEERVEDVKGLKQLLAGGDVLRVGEAEKVLEMRGGPVLINGYGPTEGTTFTSCNVMREVGEVGERMSIGRPITNTEVYVLDEEKNAVGIGVVGELYIGGEGLANGYVGRAGMTGGKFVPNPYSGSAGARMYETGDEVRMTGEGKLEFVGRKDRQVKVRGYRVEIGEIESVMKKHEGVREAVVVAREGERKGEKRLVAYTVSEREGGASGRELREYMRERVPEYMVPGKYIEVRELPLTPNGKLDRKALIEVEEGEEGREWAEAETPTEELLVGMWTQMLGLERVGIHENFFELGGHSLIATRVISRVRKAFGVEMSVRKIFESPTIAELADEIEGMRGEGKELGAIRLRAEKGKGPIPLSFAQKRIWFLDQLEAGQSIYNVPMAISIEGELNTTALVHSIREIVRRHEALRTIFTVVDGEPAQEVNSNISLSVPIIDLRSLLEEEVEKEARRVQGQEARRVFDLATGPLMRAAVVRLEDRKQVLMLTMHHIVSDGWSVGVLFDELKALYGEYEKGEPTGLRELAIQYGDYACWQEGWMKGEVLEGELEYWRKQLEGAEGELRMPTDRGRPAEQTFEGGREEIRLTKETSEGLREMSREESVSLYMTLLAGFKVMINRYTGETDIVVGTPIANRNRAEVEGLIGFFVNTLAMRSDLRGNPSFRELMGRTREVALGAYGHQELPFEKLVEEVEPERSLSRTPIFQVMFAVQNAPAKRIELGELRVRRMEVEAGTEKFDITVGMKESEEGIEGTLSYNKALFDKTTCRRMARRYEQVLEEVVRDREKRLMEIGILREEERQQVLVEWNDTGREREQGQCVDEILEREVRERPDAIAVEYGEEKLSYRELNRRGNQLGRYVRRRGVRAGEVVGICMERSLEMVIGLIGVVKAGGAYLPLGQENPDERLRFMIEDTGVRVVIAGKEEGKRIERIVEEREKEGMGEEREKREVEVIGVEGRKEEISEESGEDERKEERWAEKLAYVMYTSGTTGEPKGIGVSHGGIVRLVRGVEYAEMRGEVFLQYAPISFDASTFEIWGSLLNGGRLVVAPEKQATLEELGRMLKEKEITTLWLTAGLFQAMVEERVEDVKGLKQLLAGGDVLRVGEAEKVLEMRGGPVLINGYGPTEGTTFTSCNVMREVGEVGERMSIGRPITNTEVYVLDEEKNAVGIGVVGELYIGGEGLANGYVGRAGMTGGKFVPNPYSGSAGARMYETGDEVRMTGEGKLEFVGRKDRQVKVRGYRVEIGEIESVMKKHEGVREAVVVAREGERKGEKRLVAYTVSEREGGASGRELREYMRERVPEYMVPGKYIEVRELPLTPNGKLDRKALIEVEEGEEGREWAEAETPTEELLVGMWTQMLGLERVGIHENFFELGGHSLIATRVISRVRKAFGVEMSVRKIFESPTIAELADEIEGMRGEGKELGAIRLRAEKGKGPIPLSFAQKRIWFLDQLEAGQSIYNVPMAISIEGELNTTALVHSIREIVRRHEALRTIFTVVDGEPAQEVNSNISLSVPIIDLRSLLEEEVEKEARRVQGQEARRVFDLATGPLMRAAVVRLEDRKQVLMLTMHHIVSDGWSVGVLFDELKALYGEYEKGEPTGLRELAIQYGDYACWQEGWMKGEVLEGELEYWRKQLEGAEGELRMPTDRGRPAEQTFEGGREEIRLTKETSEGLREMSREESVSLYMTLLAGFKVMINRYTGETDIVVGTPIANRNRAEVEGLIGFFVNTLAMRSDLRGNPSFRELMGRTREVALGAYGHQELPFEKLVEEVEPERSLSRTPIFQVMFAVQNAPAKRMELGELRVRRMEVEAGTEKFDLTVVMKDSEGQINGTISYNNGLFDQVTIKRMVRHYETVLEAALASADLSISDLGLMTEAERHQILSEWNESHTIAELLLCTQLAVAQMERTPEAVAVEFEDQHVSYRTLHARANKLARHLLRLGVGPETLVGVYLERSPEMITAVLGILKAGGAYVPLDVEYPPERIRFILEDARVSVVLTRQYLRERVFGQGRDVVCLDTEWQAINWESDEEPHAKVDAENLAYVMFTSGSTGGPKGVAMSHYPLMNLLQWQIQNSIPESKTLQFASLTFDVSFQEIFSTLCSGGALCLIGEEDRRDAYALWATVVQRQVQRLFVPFVALQQMAEVCAQQEATPASIREIFTAGEQLRVGRTLVRMFDQLDNCVLANHYGPTEAHVVSSHVLEAQPNQWPMLPPIGRPVSNAQLHVLNNQHKLGPANVPGELHIGGVCLARGYLNRPELTAEKFIPDGVNLMPGARLYRTGDLARHLHSGALDFLGRVDDQVKVRGFRVEPGEVEAVLAEHPGVRAAVVVTRHDATSGNRLVAYLVLDEGGAVSDSSLRAYLGQRLPEYMVPSAFVAVKALPMTPSGKVDRRSLPETGLSRSELGMSRVAPRTLTEERLAEIWSGSLKLDSVGVHENFFELGGHSLIATRVISRVRKAFGVEMSVRKIFESPTIAELADEIEGMRGEGKELGAIRLRAEKGKGPIPLSFAQKRIWFLDQLEAGQSIYNVPMAISIEGELNTTALVHSIREIVRRHEALRTIFTVVDGEPAQEVISNISLSVPIIDLRSLPEEEVEKEARRVQGQEARRVFDLATGPLMRAAVVRLEDRKQVLMLTMHHIVSDGWSVGVLFDELKALYGEYEKGEPTGLRELAIQYGDYACWQEGWMKGEVLEGELEYWRKQLEGAEGELRMPTDRGRPAEQTFEGGREEIRLTKETSEGLREMSREESVSLYMTLLAGFKVMISRYTGQTDIVVGTPIANRNRAEVEGLIGFFVNTLAMRSDLRGNPSFRELMGRTREVALGAYGHQELPFEKLVEEVEPERSLSRTPIFQVMFAVQNAPAKRMELGELRVRRMEVEAGTEKFDITVGMKESEEGIEGTLSYNKALFDKTTCRRMARRYEQVLEEVVRDREKRLMEIGILREEERQQVLVEWNDTGREREQGQCVDEILEREVRERPDAIAVEYGEEKLSYRELNRRGNQLGRYVRRRGVRAGEVVGICMERSLEMVIGLIGVVKAGGAYLPLGQENPDERLRFMIEDTGVRVVIAGKEEGKRIERIVEEREKEGMGEEREKREVEVIGVEGRKEEISEESGEDERKEERWAEKLAYVMYTSGTTGEPKGIGVSHGGIVRLVRGVEYAEMRGEVFLQYAPISFDASTFEIWGSLLNGGRLVVAPEKQATLEELGRMLKEKEITTLWLTAGLFQAMVEERVEDVKGLKQLLAGGDVLRVGEAEKVLEMRGGPVLINGYGPTEGTTFTSCNVMREVGEVGERMSIGRPITNTEVYVLDEEKNAVGIGVVGELYIGGEGLANGYVGRAGMTGGKFVPNPYSGSAGARMYETGDEVRMTGEGKLEFVGRKDRQVKVRGYRVEIGEIESVMKKHEGVREAVVVAREGERKGEKRLVAYTVSEREGGASGRELREYMRERVPEYMVPGKYIEVRELPLTPNGKLDRKALMEVEEEEEGREWAEAETPTEELLVGMWTQMLGLERVGVHENFFELGGHSLLATRMVSRIRNMFEIDLPLRTIFEEPTVEFLARRVEQERKAGRAPTPPIRPSPRIGSLPLSFAQQRLWFLDQFDRGSTAYSIPFCMDIDGPLDAKTLERAFSEIIRRHEVLRTVFQLVDGLPTQVIRPAEPVEIPIVDLRAIPERMREAEERRIVACESQSCFDLGQGPLIRVKLIRSGEHQFVLLINMHHAVTDGWSLEVMLHELEELYVAFISDRRPVLPELPIQYLDYAVWQREHLQGEVLERQLEYWRTKLADLVPLELPTDGPRELVCKSSGAVEGLVLSEQMTRAVKTLAAQQGATLFMTLLAAFKVLLSRWTGQHDVAVGSPIAGRSKSETDNLIGFFVNTIVLRSDLSGNPGFGEVIRRVREAALGAYAHQDIPFEKLVEELQPERDLRRSPFFSVFFNMPGIERRPQMELAGASAHHRPVPEHQSKFDLSLYAVEEDGRITLSLLYDADLFLQPRMAELMRQLEVLLLQAVDEPERPIGELSLVTPASREFLPDPTKPLERAWLGPVHARIQEHARHRPHQIAITDKQVSLTYRDLDVCSDRVADSLISKGVRSGDVIAVLSERSASLVVALVGVMKAGAAFMILDPRLPDERLMSSLRIAQPRGLLHDETSTISAQPADSLRSLLPMWNLQIELNYADEHSYQQQSGNPPVDQSDPDAIAYVVFTSGSTGVPKAVIGTHAPLSHFLDWHCRTFMLTERDRFCMLSGLSHDPLLRDIFTPLWQGAKLCVPDPDDIGSRRLAEWMRSEAITVAHLTPALAATLTAGEKGDRLEELRYTFFGGDVLTGRDTINLRKLAPNASFVNLYGTTETPQAMGYFVVGDAWRGSMAGSPAPLGRGIDDVQLLVLNELGRLAGVGELGEISVRTPHLTTGYLNDSELTKAKYVINKFTGREGDRVYRTGDLGRYLPDGNVEFAGRADEQVKVRGYRIELQEVRGALQTHACVRDCVVVDRECGAGDRRLVAYVVPVEKPPTVRELRQHLSSRLPEYMLPAFFVTLDRLPLTRNGKLDRAALPAPGQSSGDDGSYLVPRTTTEELLAAIWSQVLQIERIGVNDNFFELGGHSLLAMQVNSRVCDTLHLDVPLRDLFTHPTLEEFARRLDEFRSGSPQEGVFLTRIPRDQELPFSFNESSLLFSHWVATTILKEGKFPFYIVVGLRLKGRFNVQALEDALNEIIRRHEILRTAFSIVGDGSPETVSRVLQLAPREIGTSLFKRSIRSQSPLSLVINNIEGVTSEEAKAVVRQELGQPFDYEEPPMLRALLFKTKAQEHHLTLLLHHIASDGWSVGILRKELATLYDAFSRGLPSSINELALQYVDFADWQHRKFQGEFLNNGFAYWKKQQSEFDLFDTRDLPFFRPDYSTRAGGYESVIIDADLLQGLRSFARTNNVTLSMFLLTGLNILLHLYTGKERIGIWSLFANRTRSGTEEMIGSFSHRHLLAMEVGSNQTGERVLDHSRDLVIDATANSEIPFILVQMLMNGQAWRRSFVEDTNETRTSHEQVSQNEHDSIPEAHVSFDLEAGNQDVYPSDGLVIEPVYLPRPDASLDLRILGTDRETHLVLAATYPRRLFTASSIREMLADFTRVLERLLLLPDAPISSFASVIRAPNLDQEETEEELQSA